MDLLKAAGSLFQNFGSLFQKSPDLFKGQPTNPFLNIIPYLLGTELVQNSLNSHGKLAEFFEGEDLKLIRKALIDLRKEHPKGYLNPVTFNPGYKNMVFIYEKLILKENGPFSHCLMINPYTNYINFYKSNFELDETAWRSLGKALIECAKNLDDSGWYLSREQFSLYMQNPELFIDSEA